MHILRQYASELPGLSDFVSKVAYNPLVQGTVLDVNPIWLRAYRIAEAGLNPEGRFWLLEPNIGAAGAPVDFQWSGARDFIRDRTSDALGRSVDDPYLPFLIKVIVNPAASDQLDAMRDLRRLVTNSRFVAIAESRPTGSLFASPGDPCLGASQGTIGGFLTDQRTNARFAATCGHVVSTGATVTTNGLQLGTCTHSRGPSLLPAGQRCTTGCSASNDFDFALVDVAPRNFGNVVTGVATSIAPHDPISMHGAASGRNNYEVGGVLLTYAPGKVTCFERLFEVRPPSGGGVLNPRLRALAATVPMPGDSGAWIETANQEWCGVLVAGDHTMGYALEAQDTISLADQLFGTRLTL